MARLPRLTVPGLPHHVIWRGNNGEIVFRDTQDKSDFLALLAEQSQANGVRVHAYVLLDAQIHLLLTPTTEMALSRMMQGVGRAYVRRFNLRHGRSGTLWEGRFRCTVVEPGVALLACMVYVDTEPVHQGMVAMPEAFAWSSLGHYIGQRSEGWLVAPAPYWALGNTPFAREVAYAELVARGLSTTERQQLADAAMKGWAVGSDGFLRALQQQTPRRVVKGRVGRPPKRPA